MKVCCSLRFIREPIRDHLGSSSRHSSGPEPLTPADPAAVRFVAKPTSTCSMDLAQAFLSVFDSDTGDFKVVVKSDDDEILATFKVMGGTGGVIYGHQVHHMKDIVAADAIAPQTRFA